jgi:hypothetical protein
MDWLFGILALILICLGIVLGLIATYAKNIKSTDAAFLGYAGGLCTGIGWMMVLNF